MRNVVFTLDGATVSADGESSLLDICRREEIPVPTLCHRDGFTPSGSCLVCLVLDLGPGRLVPACATRPREGMEVVTGGETVREARLKSLELLLSEHVGECEAPCVRACPGGVDVPVMMRQIAAGRPGDALATIRRRVAMPASLSWICAAPCEGACRRRRHDGPLSICLLKRYAAGRALSDPSPPEGRRAPSSGRRVAVAGAGPAGMSAAWFLLQEGHGCTVFEKESVPGGSFLSRDGPPREVLEAEVEALRRRGADILTGVKVGRDTGPRELLSEFDAVVLATGASEGEGIARLCAALAVEAGERGIAVERHTWRTSREGVFAAGSVIRPHRHPAYAAAQGRDAARAVHVLLRGPGEEGGKRRFSSVIGSLLEGETGELLKEASPSPPVQPASDSLYSDGEARKESARCMHCDCRRKEDCGLRNLAEEFGAVQRRFAGKERVRLLRVTEHPEIILEPGKCIRCGLCLEAAARNPAVPGLCFKGKGIDMRVGTPFDISLKEALDTTGPDCANVCPTGAISHRRRGQGEERP